MTVGKIYDNVYSKLKISFILYEIHEIGIILLVCVKWIFHKHHLKVESNAV